MKKVLITLILMSMLFAGCSSKKKEDSKDTGVTDTKEPPVTETKPEPEKSDPHTKEISNEEKQLLYERTEFMNKMNVMHQVNPGETTDFSDKATLELRFYFLTIYGFDNGYFVGEGGEPTANVSGDIVRNLGIQLYNKELSTESAGWFENSYDSATDRYGLPAPQLGGALLPYYVMEEITYSIDENGDYIVSVPSMASIGYPDENGEIYKRNGTIHIRYGKSSGEAVNFYYKSIYNEPLE